MSIEKKSLYISYFWKNLSMEQLEDMMELSIESIPDYILIMGKEFYLSDNIVNSGKINKILLNLHTVK